MKKLILFIVKSIVDKADEVMIKEEETEFNYTNISLTVGENDMGKVIGKSGKIIKALRILLRVLAIKQGKKINLLLNENLPS